MEKNVSFTMAVHNSLAASKQPSSSETKPKPSSFVPFVRYRFVYMHITIKLYVYRINVSIYECA